MTGVSAPALARDTLAGWPQAGAATTAPRAGGHANGREIAPGRSLRVDKDLEGLPPLVFAGQRRREPDLDVDILRMVAQHRAEPRLGLVRSPQSEEQLGDPVPGLRIARVP